MERLLGRIGKKPFVRTVILIFSCIALNLLTSAFARLLNLAHIPLYLDNIGTVFASILGGALPGVIVGFATNLINSFFTTELTMYYGTISVILALIVRYFYISGFFKTIRKRLFSSAVLGIICGVLGTVLSWIIYGFSFGAEISAGLAKKMVSDWQIYPLASQFASEIIINLIDKILTVFAAYLLIIICPDYVKRDFKMPDAGKERITAVNRFKSFMNSLLGNVVKTMLLFQIILSVTVTGICYYMYRSSNIQKYSSTCADATAVSLNVIDPDDIDSYVEERQRIFDEYIENLPNVCKWDPISYPEYFTDYYEFSHQRYSEKYLKTEESLKKIADSFAALEYLYVYRIEEDGCHVVFDVDESAYVPVQKFDESFKPLIPNLLAGENIEPMVTDDTYGWLLSYFNPLRNADGECVAYVCADISMDDLRIDQTIFILKTVTILIGASLIVLVIVLNVFEHNIVKPIVKISSAASDYAFDTEDSRKIGSDRIMNLNIDSCSEVEELYESLKKLSSDSQTYISKIKSDAESMKKMQDGIIIDFANMVENRDKNTGDHIKKTSLYVRAIAEELRREGVYKDSLTNDYIEKIVRSAPLHDVGKITVSDVILNKPGKLTDEEFEIMKTHAKAGYEILKNASINIGDTEYLKEAINMAHYHHEWWNGNGYPDKLSGTDIPLSARIMAVADVYDALVSKRSYKSAFPRETAISIMKEESGTHFDPAIVTALLNVINDL